MPSDLFRNRLVSKIRAAIAEYKEARHLKHALLKGRVREIAVQNLFEPLLSPDFQIGTGTIADKNSEQSAETDLIIYSKKLLLPILYGERFGTFPLDCCLTTVEIKSKLTATELQKTIKNASIMPELKYSSHKVDTETKRQSVAVVTRTLFAFESNLKNKDELDRYKEKDSGWNTCPLIKVFCVIDKGMWLFDTPRKKWLFQKATEEHEEVISFLVSIIDHLVEVFESRGQPKIGNYIGVEKLKCL